MVNSPIQVVARWMRKKGSYIDSGWGLDDPSAIVEELKAGFQRFLEGHTAHPHASEARRHQLAGGQHPQVALLACSDSRVPVEVIFDAGFGDLFVIRNAGNTNTFGSAGSIEYAVLDLNVRVLVVMSHQGCGAVKAAYLKETSFSASLTELVTDIKTGLTSHGISTDDLSSYNDGLFAPRQHHRNLVDGHQCPDLRCCPEQKVDDSTSLSPYRSSGHLLVASALWTRLNLWQNNLRGDPHGIAIRKKAIVPFDCLVIQLQQFLSPDQGTYQQQQRTLG